MEKIEYRQLPERENHNCFGCSSTNASGLHLKFFTDEESVFSWVSVPDHLCGWDGLVHGGVLSTILDETMGWCAFHMLKKITLTKSMTVNFLKPVYIGTQLRAEGRVHEVKSEREVLVDGFIFNKEGELCVNSVGTFATFTVQAMRKLGIMNEPLVKSLEHLVEE